MLCLLVALCLLPAAFSADPDPAVLEEFKKHVRAESEKLWYSLDFNNNGAFDRSDLQTMIHDYDSDNSGHVSKEEFQYHWDVMEPTLAIDSGPLFAEYDDNNDGVIDSLDLDGVYNRMDKNGDGSISHDEFVDYFTAVLTLLFIFIIQGQ